MLQWIIQTRIESGPWTTGGRQIELYHRRWPHVAARLISAHSLSIQAGQMDGPLQILMMLNLALNHNRYERRNRNRLFVMARYEHCPESLQRWKNNQLNLS